MLFGTEEQKHYYMDFLPQRQAGQPSPPLSRRRQRRWSHRTHCGAGWEDYILNGRKCFITSGGLADVYTVFATVDRSLGTKGITCFIVEKDRPGVSVGGRGQDGHGAPTPPISSLRTSASLPRTGGRGGQGASRSP